MPGRTDGREPAIDLAAVTASDRSKGVPNAALDVRIDTYRLRCYNELATELAALPPRPPGLLFGSVRSQSFVSISSSDLPAKHEHCQQLPDGLQFLRIDGRFGRPAHFPDGACPP